MACDVYMSVNDLDDPITSYWSEPFVSLFSSGSAAPPPAWSKKGLSENYIDARDRDL